MLNKVIPILGSSQSMNVVNLTNQISQKLKLTFISENETNGNVCFANNPDLRDAFKTSFTQTDVNDYICAVFHSIKYRAMSKKESEITFKNFPIPKDADTFWRLVLLGGEIRKTDVSDKILSDIDKIIIEH